MKSIGPYEILQEFHVSANGSIFLGRDSDGEVCIKTIDAVDADPQLIIRFYQEARLCARLSHANLVKVLRLGEQQGIAFIAMERLRGMDLRQFIRQRLARPLESKLRVMAKICDALAYAHSEGIIHRDVKPSNIFLEESDNPKILDFGIARVRGSSLTAVGKPLGTPDYMAPEQRAGLPVTDQSDVFSAAVVFFEFLTFVHPFGTNSAEWNSKTPAASLCEIDPLMPKILDRLLARGLSLDPADRFSSATEFATALRQARESLKPKVQELQQTALQLSDSIARKLQNPNATYLDVIRAEEQLRALLKPLENIADVKEEIPKAVSSEAKPLVSPSIAPQPESQPESSIGPELVQEMPRESQFRRPVSQPSPNLQHQARKTKRTLSAQLLPIGVGVLIVFVIIAAVLILYRPPVDTGDKLKRPPSIAVGTAVTTEPILLQRRTGNKTSSVTVPAGTEVTLVDRLPIPSGSGNDWDLDEPVQVRLSEGVTGPVALGKLTDVSTKNARFDLWHARATFPRFAKNNAQTVLLRMENYPDRDDATTLFLAKEYIKQADEIEDKQSHLPECRQLVEKAMSLSRTLKNTQRYGADIEAINDSKRCEVTKKPPKPIEPTPRIGHKTHYDQLLENAKAARARGDCPEASRLADQAIQEMKDSINDVIFPTFPAKLDAEAIKSNCK